MIKIITLRFENVILQITSLPNLITLWMSIKFIKIKIYIK